MRRWLWLIALLLLAGGVSLVAARLPALKAFERAEQDLQQARDSGDLLAEGQALEALAEISPADSGYWQQAGEVYFSAGKYEEALAALQKAVATGKMSSSGLKLLGDTWLALGNATEAVQKWEQAALMGDQASFASLAEFYRGQKDWENYATWLQKWMNADPDRGIAYLEYGYLQAALGNETALEDLSIAKQKIPEKAGEVSEVENALLAGSLSAYIGFARVYVGRALGTLDYWDFAEIAFSRAVEVDPDYAEAWAFLSEAKFQQSGGGESEILKALALNPESVIARALYAMRLRRDGNPEEALPFLLAVAAAEPRQVIWRLEIAATLAELGKVPESLAELQAAVKIEPQNVAVWRQLTRFCIQHNLELRTVGLPAAREVLRLAPEDAESLDLMGLTFFLLEDSTSAERFLLRAVQADETFADSYLHLGQLYLNQQRNPEAYPYLKQAERLAEPGSEVHQLVNRLLERYFGEVEAAP